jgi:hypothetical protein
MGLPQEVDTPCGKIMIPLPSITIPGLPSLNIFPLPFPPELSIPMPDCDVIKNAIGAVAEPAEDSQP